MIRKKYQISICTNSFTTNGHDLLQNESIKKIQLFFSGVSKQIICENLQIYFWGNFMNGDRKTFLARYGLEKIICLV